MTLRLVDIWDLAYRFVPTPAADWRLYESGCRSWWPAHEIGHFLVATPDECAQYQFDLDLSMNELTPYTKAPRYRYVIAREIAATSISQRLLRRSRHVALAEEEIQYTDETTLECAFERWCKQSVGKLLRANKALRLPTTRRGLEALLTDKASAVGSPHYSSRRDAKRARNRQQACRTI
jgi:hypothetical protein